MSSTTTKDPSRPTAIGEPSIEEVIDAGQVLSVYQPIVELSTGETVAYEALARGPKGTTLERPDRLFEAARRQGLVAELDLACQTAAIAGANTARLGAGDCLFINAEPGVTRDEGTRRSGPLGVQARADFHVVVELTERQLARHPLHLLDDVRRLKALGYGIAIDDLGAESASLALLPFIEPDIIKLDLRLIRDYGTPEIATIALAVQADAERRSSIILAEGIENDADAATARVLGAELGQGWHYGRPGPLIPDRRATADLWGRLPHSPTRPKSLRSPWELVANRPDIRIASKELLLPISNHIEQLVERETGAPVLLSAFQHARHFTQTTARRYQAAARQCSLVGALGVDLATAPAPNVRGGQIQAHHPLAGEWTVTVVGPHHAAALIARDLGDPGPDRQRRFQYLVTQDRSLVVSAAQILLELLHPAGAAPSP